MAQLLVRKIPESVKAGLVRRARRHGRSTEDEVRHILAKAATGTDLGDARLGTRLTRRFAKFDLAKPFAELRGSAAKPARFS